MLNVVSLETHQWRNGTCNMDSDSVDQSDAPKHRHSSNRCFSHASKNLTSVISPWSYTPSHNLSVETQCALYFPGLIFLFFVVFFFFGNGINNESELLFITINMSINKMTLKFSRKHYGKIWITYERFAPTDTSVWSNTEHIKDDSGWKRFFNATRLIKTPTAFLKSRCPMSMMKS